MRPRSASALYLCSALLVWWKSAPWSSSIHTVTHSDVAMNTPTSNHDPPSIDAFKNIIQIASTLLIGASTAFFVIGLLVVNLRLSSYGVHYLEIDRAEYVLVGVVTVFLCASSYFALKFVVNRVKLANSHRKTREFKKAGARLLEAIATLSTARYVLMGVAPEISTTFFAWKVWASIALLGAVGNSVRLVGAKIYGLWTQMRAGEVVPEAFAQRVTSVAELVAGSLGMLGLYSFLTYPMISMAWGGGHRDPVEMFLTVRGTQIAKNLGLPMLTTSAAGPLYVLSESEHEVVVTTELATWGAKSFVRLQRELIEATKSIDIAAVKSSRPQSTNVPVDASQHKDATSSSRATPEKGNLPLDPSSKPATPK